MQQFTFEAIGTHWQINYHFQGTTLEIENFEKAIKNRIEKFDKNYSRFKSGSLVSKWAKKAGEYELPSDAGMLFGFYKELYDATEGLITPLIGKTMEQTGYDARYSLKPKKLTTPPKWEESIEFPGPGPGNKGNNKLIVKLPVLVDFGAAGKGYLADIVAHLLYTHGIDHFCINAGGDIYTREMPQIIGLEDPDDASRILGEVEISSGAMCASAGNRRKWDKFHHIINPKTLVSPTQVKATWVKADNTMLADGIATALFFVSPESLLKTFNFDYAMIEGDDMKLSKNFNAELFKA